MKIILGGNKGLSTFVDDEDYETFDLGSYKWFPSGKPGLEYAKTHKNGKQMSLHRLIMRLENAPRSVYVDHIDHNGLNNLRTNLRVTDNMGNQRNARKHLSAKTYSPYKGVCKIADNRTNKWQAYITLSGKQKNLGYYRTEIEAAMAYNNAALELFGQYACLNVIRP